MAINRCLDIIAPSLSEQIFKGRRLWFLTLFFILEGVWVGILNPPILFNGLIFAWFLNPYFGYTVNTTFVVSNVLVLFGYSGPVGFEMKVPLNWWLEYDDGYVRWKDTVFFLVVIQSLLKVPLLFVSLSRGSLKFKSPLSLFEVHSSNPRGY